MDRAPRTLLALVPLLGLAACCARPGRPTTCRPAPAPECAPAPRAAVPAPKLVSSGSTEPAVLLESYALRFPMKAAEAILGDSNIPSPRRLGPTPTSEARALGDLAVRAGAEVLAHPSVVTRSGEEASIHVGEVYPGPSQDLHLSAKARAELRASLWSGHEMRFTPTVLADGAVALDLSAIFRAPPPANLAPDPAALVAHEARGRLRIERLAPGQSALLTATDRSTSPASVVLWIVTPTVLPAETAVRAK